MPAWGSESVRAFSIRLRPGSLRHRPGLVHRAFTLGPSRSWRVVTVVSLSFFFFKGDGTECHDHSKLPRMTQWIMTRDSKVFSFLAIYIPNFRFKKKIRYRWLLLREGLCGNKSGGVVKRFGNLLYITVKFWKNHLTFLDLRLISFCFCFHL